MCLLISIPVVLLSGLSRLCAGQSQSQSAPNISAAMQNATIVQQDNSTNYYHFFDADGVEIGKYSSPEFHAALVPAADTWSCTKVTWAQFQSWNGGNFVTNMNDFLRTSGYRLAPGDAVSNPIRSLDAATSGAPGPLLFRCVDTSTPHKLYAPGIMECSELREATIRKSSTITGGPVNLRYTSGFSTTGIFTIKENRWVAQAPPVIERLRFTVPQIVQGSAAKDTSATIENTVGMRLEVGVSGETDGYVTAQAPPNSKCGLEFTAAECGVRGSAPIEFELRGFLKVEKDNVASMFNAASLSYGLRVSAILVEGEWYSTSRRDYTATCKVNNSTGPI